jgi:hypothetical protein
MAADLLRDSERRRVHAAAADASEMEFLSHARIRRNSRVFMLTRLKKLLSNAN